MSKKKRFILLSDDIRIPSGVGTMSKEIVVNTDIEKFVVHRYVRHNEPVPAGLGRDSFLVTMWKRTN